MIDRTYFRFLAHAGDIPASLSVDRIAVALLDEISLCDAEPLSVTEAMSLSFIASPATIHRKIDELLEKGLIEHFYEDNNRRTKFLVPSAKALDHYARLGAAVKVAAK
jgi:hypothetical protein